MHCFIGLEIEKPLSEEIIQVQHHWQELNLPLADFHKHTNPHITLVPPFDCKRPKGLATELAEIGASFPTFAISFMHVEAFNHRILHLAAEANAVIELRARLLETCAVFAPVHDSHPFFHPHSTLGYTHEPLTNRQLTLAADTLEAALHLPRRAEFSAFYLFGREQPAIDYKTLAVIPLGGQS